MATPANGQQRGPSGPPGPPGGPAAPPDPMAILRSRAYIMLLVLAAILGVPISAAAYGFLALVNGLQQELFTHLPHGLGLSTVRQMGEKLLLQAIDEREEAVGRSGDGHAQDRG